MRNVLALSALALALVAAPLPAQARVEAPNQPPELEYPPYHRVAPGREISFGLNVVNQDSDTVSVELVNKPASASYDPVTLTVRWKPTAKDAPAGHFRVRLTEVQRVGGAKRSFLHDFSIAVDEREKLAPSPPPLGDAVELLITIHDPERLAQVNKDWPITRMLDVVRRVELARLPEADRQAAAPGGGIDLYRDAVKLIALRHKNPRANPEAAEFAPAAWKIVTVRPRLDKKAQELRVVYQDMAVAEPVYLMFRFRLVRDLPDLPADELAYANQEFTRLTYEAFFQGDALNPKLIVDKRAHGRAVSDYIGKVLNYTSDRPHMGTEFMALPHEARFGGGSARSADGTAYASGDGWAWAVFKPKWTDDHHLTLASVPIPGFTSEIRTSADGTKWQTVCAPKFDPDDASHAPGYEVLCRKKLGFTDLPMAGPDGKVAPSPIDATNLFVDHKLGDMVKWVDLRDPRRGLFEENGMTCSQCHVRDFGVGDLRDPAFLDPRKGVPRFGAQTIPTTFFNIVPEETWRPFTIEFQRLQECAFRAAFDKLGKKTNLVCPLVAE